MGDRALAFENTGNEQPKRKTRDTVPKLWYALASAVLVGAALALAARIYMGPRVDLLLVGVAVADTAVLALRVALRRPVTEGWWGAEDALTGDPHKNLLDSTGPAVAAIDLDGRLTYMNPSAERMLGYTASELMARWEETEIFAPGEAERVLSELQRLSGSHSEPDDLPGDELSACLECIRRLPPSTTPGFNVRLRGKNGNLMSAVLHISAMRNASGVLVGLAAVAVEAGSREQREQALRPLQESFMLQPTNPNEMIATLDMEGHFISANAAWERCFGVDYRGLRDLEAFADLFALNSRVSVSTLFQRALSGEKVECPPLFHHTPDGRLVELEMSLYLMRGLGGKEVVRCVFHDVTQERQREKREALQLAVNEIVGENTSPEDVSKRILEALCLSQGWDMAIKWEVDPKQDRLRYGTAWVAPGSPETLMKESVGVGFAAGDDLPGRAWKAGKPIWIADLASLTSSTRTQSMLRHKMASGWASPVYAGKKVVAVLEFYSHLQLREDHEAEASVDAVAASLGQMLLHSHERGRADELSRQQQILLDSVTDGICGIDREGRVTFANPAAGRLLGAEPSMVTGKPVHDVLHGSAGEGRRCGDDCSIRSAALRHVSASGEENIFRSDGSSFPAEYVLTPIVDHGRITGSVLSFRDISQRFALDKLKDEFISTVSHELRTPLTSIRGALGLLSAGVLEQSNEKASNLLRIAQSNSDRLVRLINDILDLERIQSGREPLTFRPVQLASLVDQVMERMQPMADSAGVQLIHDETQAEISADPDRLEQVVTNLLSNAIKFSPPNSSVSVMLRPGVNGVTLSVIDQGRGIPSDKLEAIFGRFQQVDASDSRQKGGSGLGLAICRTIIMQHSGRIWAERNPVRGSTFRVFLPFRPEPLRTAEEQESDERATGAVLASGSSADTLRQASAPVSNL